MSSTISLQTSTKSYDVVVIGSGLAGITAAFRAADARASVLLCSKTRLCSGSSFYPMMDTLHCQCTIDEQDEELFMQDIRDCSARMNDAYMNRYYITHIRDCLRYFAGLGIPVHKLPEPKLACFASHPHDLYYWKDWDAIRKSLYTAIAQKENLALSEQADLISVIRDNPDAPKACGVCLYHRDTNTYEFVPARAVILATGGFGALYKHNLNSPDVSGDGQAIALKAGASLINLEFNQFIPGFISPGYKIVFREGSLDYCDGLYDVNGINVLREQFVSDEEMRNCLKLRAPHGPFTTADGSGAFDLALLKAALTAPDNGVRIGYRREILNDPRSYVADYIQWLKEIFHIDIVQDSITIAPFFHAANGGILVDHQCQSSLPGLFACGECAGGIHGADRLGGNASGSCLVFGSLAAESAVRYAADTAVSIPAKEEILQQLQTACRAADGDSLHQSQNSRSASDGRSSLEPSAVILRVKEIMWQYANIARDQAGLETASAQVRELKAQYHPWPLLTRDAAPKPETVFQAEHFLPLAEAILLSMSQRRESRGGHYRSDYPKQDPAFAKRIAIRLDQGVPIAFRTPCRDADV